jgi:hypothetical protein
MACCRLFTFPPRPDLPLRKVPFLRRRIALSTFLLAPLLYLLPLDFRDDRFLVGIRPLRNEGRSKAKSGLCRKEALRVESAAGYILRSDTRRSAGGRPNLRRSSPPSMAPMPVATKVYPASMTTLTIQTDLVSALPSTRMSSTTS